MIENIGRLPYNNDRVEDQSNIVDGRSVSFGLTQQPHMRQFKS